jgi:large subunit ribosomal protein L14
VVHKETKLRCSDNSGANIVKCVTIYGGMGRHYAKLGDLIRVVIKNFRKKKRTLRQLKGQKKELKKRILYFGLIVSTKKTSRRRDGMFFKSDSNKILLLSSDRNFVGTKIRGYVTKELNVFRSHSKYQKILVLARFIL